MKDGLFDTLLHLLIEVPLKFFKILHKTIPYFVELTP